MTDDPLEELTMVPPHLDDDGFTARVMAALPPRRRDPVLWLEGASALALALAAAVALPEVLGTGAAWLAELARLPPALAPSLLLAALAAAAGVSLGGWWLAQGSRVG